MEIKTVHEITKTINDIDQILTIIEKNEGLHLNSIVKTLKSRRANLILQLYDKNKLIIDDTIERYINNQPKKAVYIQLKNDYSIYLDYDRNTVHIYDMDKEMYNNYEIDEMDIVSGDDICTIEPPLILPDYIKKYMSQP